MSHYHIIQNRSASIEKGENGYLSATGFKNLDPVQGSTNFITYINNSGEIRSWDFDSVWSLNAEDRYPMLNMYSSMGSTYPTDLTDVIGEQDITTPQDLYDAFANGTADASYTIRGEIDFSDVTWYWGDESTNHGIPETFSGTIVAEEGCVIKNLRIVGYNNTGTQDTTTNEVTKLGLVKNLSETARIIGLTFDNVTIEGDYSDYVGVLAGYNSGADIYDITIKNVTVSTSGGSSSKRPQIIKGEDKGSSSSDFGQPARQPRAPVADNRYQHSFTGEVPYNSAQQNNTFAQNPVLNGGTSLDTQFGQGGQPRPTVQPSMNSQSAFSQQSSNSQNFNQPNTSSNSFANGNASQPQNFSTNQPASVSKFGTSTQQQVGSVNQGVNGARPTVNPIGANQNNPYASFNNFTQNSPYNRPQTNTVSNNMPPRPVAPQPPRPMQPQGQGNVPRPVQNGGGQQNFNSQSSGTPRVNPFAQNVNRPANPAQMPRQNANPFAPPPPQPQRPVAPRPPVTPFTTPNNTNNNGTNNGNGGNNPAV